MSAKIVVDFPNRRITILPLRSVQIGGNMQSGVTLPRHIRAFACFAAALACFHLLPHLQAQVATATILGAVTDTSGAVIAEASIRVRNIGTGAGQSVVTDAQGRYNVADLGIGDYE